MLSLILDDWIFQSLKYNDFHFPSTLHVGDYNMDGFPDVVTVLSSPMLVKSTTLYLMYFSQIWAVELEVWICND